MVYLLSQIVDRTAEGTPDREAFRCAGQSLTYQALVARSNRLARMLVDQGVRRGDRVGIYLRQSLESAVAVYGIMKAGAAYVPLDPAVPLSRLAFMVRDCGLRVVVSEASRRARLQELAAMDGGLTCAIGCAGDDQPAHREVSWSEVDQLPSTAPAVTLMEQDMAYLMYTSGSTGDPKGMVHTHHSGLSYAKLAAEVYELDRDDRLSSFPPLHFDQSTFAYFSGPLAGATTVIVPEEYGKLPASLSSLIADEKLSVWYSVPFALVQLLLRGALAERDLRSLRWVLYGGEPFPPKHLRALMTLLPGARFSNVYGPAETNQCTYYHVPPVDEAERGPTDTSIPIGLIWPNAEGAVVDEDDNDVAPGEIGELLVRTPTLMRGYWRRPDLNAKAFHYRTRDGGLADRFYRTGDLVRLRSDGNYEFVGRRDRQVKTRGYRVELDEVEAAVLSFEPVAEAAVFGVADAEGTQQLQAAVVAKDGADIDAAALSKFLAARLPRYALPGKIELRRDFPRTTSGKIDRRRLQFEAERR